MWNGCMEKNIKNNLSSQQTNKTKLKHDGQQKKIIYHLIGEKNTCGSRTTTMMMMIMMNIG